MRSVWWPLKHRDLGLRSGDGPQLPPITCLSCLVRGSSVSPEVSKVILHSRARAVFEFFPTAVPSLHLFQLSKLCLRPLFPQDFLNFSCKHCSSPLSCQRLSRKATLHYSGMAQWNPCGSQGTQGDQLAQHEQQFQHDQLATVSDGHTGYDALWELIRPIKNGIWDRLHRPRPKSSYGLASRGDQNMRQEDLESGNSPDAIHWPSRQSKCYIEDAVLLAQGNKSDPAVDSRTSANATDLFGVGSHLASRQRGLATINERGTSQTYFSGLSETVFVTILVLQTTSKAIGASAHLSHPLRKWATTGPRTTHHPEMRLRIRGMNKPDSINRQSVLRMAQPSGR